METFRFRFKCELGESAGLKGAASSQSEFEAKSNLLMQAAKSPKLAKKVIQVKIKLLSEKQTYKFLRPQIRGRGPLFLSPMSGSH